MAEEQFGERTEPATQRRKDEARREGRVARSVELTSAITLLAALAALAGFGPALLENLLGLVRGLILESSKPAATSGEIYGLFRVLSVRVGLLLLPLLLCVAAVGVSANLAQVGFLFTTKTLMPRWQLLDPIQGLRRLWSIRGLVELGKALLKVLIIGGVAYGTVVADMAQLLPLAGTDGRTLLLAVGSSTLRLGTRVGLALLGLAVLDYAYQRWEWERSLRMTRREVEEEQKEMEGDPRLKSRIRALQRERARRRMILDVKKADVVITNPIHVAVALQYDRGRMAAPIVLAKGLRKIAERIKQEARDHRIPIIEDPPLARVLHKTATIGKPIPADLYRAVAQVLAHVWRLRRGLRSIYRGGASPQSDGGRF